MYPFRMRYDDGSEVTFQTPWEYTQRITACRHEEVGLIAFGYSGIACWKCLSVEVWRAPRV